MPPSAKPITSEEEEKFMKALLAGLDDSIFDAVPSSPITTPVKNTTRRDVKQVQNAICRDLIPAKEKKTNVQTVQEHSKEKARAPLGRVALNKPVDANDIDMDALFDGAEDWDWKDMDIDDDHDIKPSTTLQGCSSILPPPPLFRESCTRCEVVQVSAPDFSEKRLVVEVNIGSGKERREITLKQDWIHTDVAIGDCINVLGEFIPCSSPCSSKSTLTSTITITSRSNMLILHPDLLLSATTVANAPSCSRKPLINLMLASNAPSPVTSTVVDGSGRSSLGEAVVWGNFLHEVMQKSMAAGTWDKRSIDETVEDAIRSPVGLGELVKLGVGIEKAKFEVGARAGGLQEFAKRFIGSNIKDDGRLTDLSEAGGSVSRLALTTLHDVEEDIWSPTYGLKGKIDASVQVIIQQEQQRSSIGSKQHETSSWTMPFEIKTGRAAGGLEHRAQTMLYTILIAERYGVEVPSGLLYYTQSEELMRVPTARNELKGLIMARNELASYMMRKRVSKSGEALNYPTKPLLPPTLDDEYKCTKCYAVDGCMLYRKAVEDVEDDSSNIAQLYDKKTSHLTLAQRDFFKKWEALVSMEEQDAVRFRKELWTSSAEEREKKGRCFAKMVVQDYKHDTAPGVARMHQHIYRFVRAPELSVRLSSTPNSNPPNEPVSLLNGSISAGDAITVSIEPDLIAIARGYVVELEPGHIAVGFDHEVDLYGILKRTRSANVTLDDKVVCRIDKDEFGSGLGRIRDNLARLFYTNGDTRRLSLVVDLVPPSFDDQFLPKESEFPVHLNVNQRDAVRKVLTAKDYAIVLGMPGTGKTSTIAEIINVLVKRGKTVLLASYTHSAVDTILLKLNDADYPILRLGSLDKVHPGIHKHTLAYQSRPTTIEQLEHQILGPPVVATTCLSVDHPLFARRYFDFCIVDEASQVTLPTCLGPLRYADKFVLVGDHFQLPPLVRSRDARAGGLDVSLFKRLVDAHPEAVVDLVYQYRMNSDIMLLSNKLIYSDRLRCGSKFVSERALALPNRGVQNFLHMDGCRRTDNGCWLEKVLDESCKAVFIDTDEVPGEESRAGDLIQNGVEAKLVCQVAEALLLCGVEQNQIGIISLYRQQIKLLSHLLHCHKEIEIITADRSQGRDKDCIIISMVKSNASSQIGELLKDWRRINVSFTRARSKLIIFGSRKTLSAAPVLAEFFKLMETNGWIISLKRGADTIHIRDSPVTQPKRRATDDASRVVSKENRDVGMQSKRKKAKLDQGVLKGRPMLQDVVNDVLL